MKPKDYSIFDFNEEDHLTYNCTNRFSKYSNPKFDDDVAITKYEFLQHASSGSITQMKEVHSTEQIHVVAIDDDDCCFVNDGSGGPQDSLVEAASKQSVVFVDMSDRISQQSCQFSGDDVKHKSPTLNMDISFSSPFGVSSRNCHMTHTSPFITESPCNNDCVDVGVSDGCDNIQESSPSTSGYEQEDGVVPFDGLPHDQSFNGLDMEEVDTILPTDYVYYGNRYFPACLIVFSDTTLKIETAESDIFEWNVEDIHGIESQWCSKAFTAKVKVRVLTKDVVQEENGQGTAGIELLEFLVHDPHWLQRQERIISLDVRYQAIWNIALNGKVCEGGPFALEDGEFFGPYIPKFEEPFDEVVYPKGDINAISISKTDVELLEPNIFLNDTIIDFYLKYLENEILSSERGRFYFFNSFFFTKLADPNRNTSGVFDGKAGYQRVRKWTRKVNIFEKDYVFIPVNYNLHWSLIVICHPGEVAKFKDENVDDTGKVPCILHMDSIRGCHTGLKDLVQSYLLEEWKEKKKENSEDIISRFLNLRFLSLELPQQENCSDCGLFLLHYAELFIAEAPKNFSPFKINKFDNFLKRDWFMPAEASIKRVYIQRLIYDLLEDSPLENNSSPSNHDSQPAILLENHENDNGIEVLSGRTSPGKSWNPLHTQSVQGLDMSLSNNVSSLGVRDLLDCQHFGQPGCSSPNKEEVPDIDDLTNLGQTKSINGVESRDCHITYTPGDNNHGFQWNSRFSAQGTHLDDTSAPPSVDSSDNSVEVMIMEHEPKIEGLDSDENKISDEQKENIDSLTESYVSASSDMMETPPEDSQELTKIYGQEMPAHQEFNEIQDVEVITNVNEVAEGSCSDSEEEHVAKRIRLTTSSDGERELIRSLSKEVQV